MKVSINKENATLNKEWAKHIRKDMKKLTAHKRRFSSRKTIRKDLKEL
ncbi:MAG TPA: hypothetical protein VK809_08645 [Bacteroidia bacterium]|jgi:hypothetical protein|nr:hypothetical protein [Bacteroidia bacterium]